MEEVKDELLSTFSCNSCGSDLHFEPGTSLIICKHCGNSNDIPQEDSIIEEFDFTEFLKGEKGRLSTREMHMIHCSSCGAESTIEPNVHAGECPYCASPFNTDHIVDEQVIQPHYVLPFKLKRKEALEHFSKWIKKLWFAPSQLKKAALKTSHFKGMYMPFWTYDANTFSNYIGQRGTYYYVQESYTTTENGKSVTKTRSVRKTRWTFVSGSVRHFFDDLLIVATESLPTPMLEKLEPWDLEHLQVYKPEYLSGFSSEKYQVDLSKGFDVAKDKMASHIRRMVRRDIGGDTQRINSVKTSYSDVSFKHILLPCYVSAYRYKDKLYRFVVNARTGEVQGERPWDKLKIALSILLGIALIVAAWYLYTIYGPQPK